MNALRNLKPRQVGILKGVLFVLALLPFVRLIAFGFLERLGANPIEFITRNTGDWTLYFLCITLAVTPLRRLTGWNWLIRLRRMLGLFFVLLRGAALHDVLLVRPFLRHRGNVARRHQAAVHHGRLHRLRATDPAGRYQHQRHGAPARRQTLAVAAPADVPDLAAGHFALLVDEGGQEPAGPADTFCNNCYDSAATAYVFQIPVEKNLVKPCKDWVLHFAAPPQTRRRFVFSCYSLTKIQILRIPNRIWCVS